MNNKISKASLTINALSVLQDMKCVCGARLVVNDGDSTIIKNKLLVIRRKRGMLIIEIKCRECGKVNIVIVATEN